MKKIILFVFALFVTLFTLVSCGNGSQTSVDPTPSPIGPTQCSHSYGDWEIVTAPTETAKGLARRRCSACGNVEEVELPALGSESYTITASTADACKTDYKLKANEGIVVKVDSHHGEIFCEDCGMDLTTDEFWANMIDLTKYESFAISLDKLALNIGSFSFNFKDAKLEIDFDGNKVSRAFGFITKVDTVVEGTTKIDVETKYYFDYEDLVLYLAKQEGENDIEYDVINMKAEDTSTDANLTNEEETTVTINKEDIVKALYYLTKVTKNTDGNLVITIDWDKISKINKSLYENSINEIVKKVTGTDLSETVTGVIMMLSQISFTDLVTMLDEQITKAETAINSALAMIPEGAIPTELTTLTDLVKHIFVQAKLATADKLETATNIKEVLLALDPSTSEARVTLGDMVLGSLNIVKQDTQTYADSLKGYLSRILESTCAKYGVSVDDMLDLIFNEELTTKINDFAALTITEIVNLLDTKEVFTKIDEIEAKVNEILPMVNTILPLDTSNVVNLIKGLLVKFDAELETKLADVTTLKGLILLLDKSTETDKYTLDEVIVDLFNITLEENEIASTGLIRIATGYLNKTIYELLAESKLVKSKLNAEPKDLYQLVEVMVSLTLKNSTQAELKLNTNGVFESASLDLSLMEKIECVLNIQANGHIEMTNIRNVNIA